MTKEFSVKEHIIKLQYKKSFKNRRQTIKEKLIRSRLYKIRYATVLDCLSECAKSHETILLDAGCGDGVFISKIICKFTRIIGLDLSFRSLLYMREKEKGIQHVPFVQGDIENLPFKSEKLPLIVSIETVEHLVEIEKGLEEIHRCLCPKGILIATVPSAINPRNISIVGESSFLKGLIKTLLSIWKGCVTHTWKDDQGFEYPHKVFGKNKIKDIIQKSGFKIQIIKNTPLVISSYENTSAERVINRLTRNYLGELFVLVAIKK